MSADNGVYILKTGNQYRVKALHAIENIHYDSSGCYSPSIIPESVYEMFEDCKHTYDAAKALYIALEIDKQIQTEYGVKVIDAMIPWRTIQHLITCKAG